ncbi:MAG: hypothetical protein FJ291_25035 [Planctomycetes bacterium]|nr:hypothetical protein [Planctomycetota bacterium]
MAEMANGIPRGVEVLVKKAAVDPDFRALLLAKRAAAATEIGLELDPAEAAMLASLPASLLEGIIARTTVSPMSRAAFLGKAAAVMLAALGADLAAAEGPPPPGGIAPDRPPVTKGEQPDRPPERDRFVLYSESNFKGEVTYAVTDTDAWQKRSTELARMNRSLRQAYVAANKAWTADEAHKGVPFPMRMPQFLQCDRVATYSDRDRAEAMLKRRQEELDKQAAAAKAAEEQRLAALGEAARAKEKEKADLLRAAEALFEKELQRLLAAPATPMPPVSRGVSMDRPPAMPPAVTGIRPD